MVKDWEAVFEAYHASNPQLYSMFKKFAYELLVIGKKRISHGTIIERLRWETIINKTAAGEFKVNQNFGRPMARRMVREFPKLDGVFEFREFKGRDLYGDAE